MPSPGLPAASRSARAFRSSPDCSSMRATRVWCSRPSTTRRRPGPRSRRRCPTRAAPWSAAACSPTSAAACRPSRSRWCSTAPRVSLTCGSARFSLQTMPVEDYPTLPDMPTATGTVQSDAFAHAVAQAVTAAGRDDMLPVLTGVRIEIDGSRSRCWPPTGSGSRSARWAGTRAPPTSRWPRWSRPGSSATPPSRSPPAARSPSRSRRPARARASSASRARPPAAYAVRPPACSTASSPRSAACSRASTRRSPWSTRPR